MRWRRERRAKWNCDAKCRKRACGFFISPGQLSFESMSINTTVRLPGHVCGCGGVGWCGVVVWCCAVGVAFNGDGQKEHRDKRRFGHAARKTQSPDSRRKWHTQHPPCLMKLWNTAYGISNWVLASFDCEDPQRGSSQQNQVQHLRVHGEGPDIAKTHLTHPFSTHDPSSLHSFVLSPRLSNFSFLIALVTRPLFVEPDVNSSSSFRQSLFHCKTCFQERRRERNKRDSYNQQKIKMERS